MATTENFKMLRMTIRESKSLACPVMFPDLPVKISGPQI